MSEDTDDSLRKKQAVRQIAKHGLPLLRKGDPELPCSVGDWHSFKGKSGTWYGQDPELSAFMESGLGPAEHSYSSTVAELRKELSTSRRRRERRVRLWAEFWGWLFKPFRTLCRKIFSRFQPKEIRDARARIEAYKLECYHGDKRLAEEDPDDIELRFYQAYGQFRRERALRD